MKRSIDYRLIASGVIELLGLASIVWGCALIAPLVGWIIGGIGLILLGLAIDPPVRRRQPQSDPE